MFKICQIVNVGRRETCLKFCNYSVNCLWYPIRNYSSHSSDEYQYLQRSKVPTLHFQKSLPRLPVPDLGKTCERYLAALKPITPDEQFKKTQSIVEQFRDGEGKALQEQLKTQDKKNKHTSYISGPWFDMYLKSRTSVVLNYNPFLGFKDDPEKLYNSQLVRATNMLISSMRFLKSLRENMLEPEVYHLNPVKSDTPQFRKIVRLFPESFSWYGAYLFKAFPLDMSQFSNLFNSTRIPRVGRDEIQKFPKARHILVIRNGHFYVFDVLDNDGNILPSSHIFSHLSYIITQNKPPPTHPVSVLTTEERDTWAEARQYLESIGNGDTLTLIDSALFALILDDEYPGEDELKYAHGMLHGPAYNRWFDKSFQLIITKEGKACINFEHSWGDGVAVLRFFNEVYKDSTKNHFVGPDTLSANVDASHLVRRLEFKIDEAMKSKISTAKENYNRSVGSLGLNFLRYPKMNRDFIKTQKLSPDSIAQLGFQMAFYKLYSKLVATYESCSTSAFKHGRTETVRSATSATRSCIEDFHQYLKPSNSDLRKRLEECTKVHNQLTKEAAMGEGFDRHLFALRVIAEQSGKSLPALFQDASYAEANHFILSTSTLFGPAFAGGSFGPVTKDGFGIAYALMDDFVGCLVSFYLPYRDGSAFIEALNTSFDDIYNILVKSGTKTGPA